MKKITKLLLLSGLLLLGAGNAWGDALSSLYVRYSTDYGTSWTTSDAMTQTATNSDIWKLDLSGSTVGDHWLVFQFTPSNDNWDGQIGAATADIPLTIDQKYDGVTNGNENKNIVMITKSEYEYTLYYDHGNNKYWIESSNANVIYFYNTLNWSSVYVHLGTYWGDNGNGAGNKDVWNRNYTMTRIEGTNYWMCKYTAAETKVSFTSNSQQNHDNFYQVDVVYRDDYGVNKPVKPVFVPCTSSNESKNSCTYYSNGAWVGYDATEFSRTLSENRFGTICSPIDATISGATLYSVVGRYNGVLYLDEASTSLTAGTPYFYKADNTGTQTLSFPDNHSDVRATPQNSNGLYGTYDVKSLADGQNFYVLSNNTILSVNNGSVNVGACRAYLKMNDGSDGEVPELDAIPTSTPERRVIAIPLDGNEVTAIEYVESNDDVVKFVENGQLFIMKNGVVYDVIGRIMR